MAGRIRFSTDYLQERRSAGGIGVPGYGDERLVGCDRAE